MNEIACNMDRLREIALDQHGFVTRSQAYNEGVSKGALAMLVKRGRLERVACGVFRVPYMPSDGNDQLMLAVLWTGSPEAALSHETALALYELGDVNPSVVHVTVEKGRRINRRGGEAYCLHSETIPPNDTGWWQGIPVVKPALAIDQCIQWGTPTYLLEQAVEEGVKKRLVNRLEAEKLRRKLDERDAA